MKRAIQFSFLVFSCFIVINACNETPAPVKTEQKAAKPAVKYDPSCEPIKDPNNPKPMALMMRLMAAHADTMRSKLLRGEPLDSIEFPFFKFYLVEPTDPRVLEAQFFRNAGFYQRAHRELFTHPGEQKKYYNLLVNACVKCHESYCSGPLKRIRKFPIQE